MSQRIDFMPPRGKASDVVRLVRGVTGKVKLKMELEFDSGAGRQTGNFPQALTHIALINPAHNLSEAKKPVGKPVMQRST